MLQSAVWLIESQPKVPNMLVWQRNTSIAADSQTTLALLLLLLQSHIDGDDMDDETMGPDEELRNDMLLCASHHESNWKVFQSDEGLQMLEEVSEKLASVGYGRFIVGAQRMLKQYGQNAVVIQCNAIMAGLDQDLTGDIRDELQIHFKLKVARTTVSTYESVLNALYSIGQVYHDESMDKIYRKCPKFRYLAKQCMPYQHLWESGMLSPTFLHWSMKPMKPMAFRPFCYPIDRRMRLFPLKTPMKKIDVEKDIILWSQVKENKLQPPPIQSDKDLKKSKQQEELKESHQITAESVQFKDMDNDDEDKKYTQPPLEDELVHERVWIQLNWDGLNAASRLAQLYQDKYPPSNANGTDVRDHNPYQKKFIAEKLGGKSPWDLLKGCFSKDDYEYRMVEIIETYSLQPTDILSFGWIFVEEGCCILSGPKASNQKYQAFFAPVYILNNMWKLTMNTFYCTWNQRLFCTWVATIRSNNDRQIEQISDFKIQIANPLLLFLDLQNVPMEMNALLLDMNVGMDHIQQSNHAERIHRQFHIWFYEMFVKRAVDSVAKLYIDNYSNSMINVQLKRRQLSKNKRRDSVIATRVALQLKLWRKRVGPRKFNKPARPSHGSHVKDLCRAINRQLNGINVRPWMVERVRDDILLRQRQLMSMPLQKPCYRDIPKY